MLLVGVPIGGLLFRAYPITAATTSRRLNRLETKVETLQKKARFMSVHVREGAPPQARPEIGALATLST